MLEKTRRWWRAHPNWTLTLATLAALAPFLAKPFNMDDPLFIWAAHQIHLHPADPYGFDVELGADGVPDVERDGKSAAGLLLSGAGGGHFRLERNWHCTLPFCCLRWR